MKKTLLFLAIFAFFGCDKTSQNSPLPPLKCDLAQKSCKNNGVIFEISPTPVIAMQKHKIFVRNLDKNLKEPRVIFQGINMFMGQISAPLKLDENGEYSGVFLLSSCILEIMRYEARIYDGDKDLGIFALLDIKKNVLK